MISRERQADRQKDRQTERGGREREREREREGGAGGGGGGREKAERVGGRRGEDAYQVKGWCAFWKWEFYGV